MSASPVLEHVSIEKLIPYARNSRTHDEAQIAQIAASIREFGFTNPVLVDGSDGIIAGHGRVLAARKLGLQQIPVLRLAHLTETQKRAYVIADNKLALNAGWDAEMLALEFMELDAAGFDLGITGFSLEEIGALSGDTGGKRGLTDDDAVPDRPGKAASQLGDLWVCGKHRVLCGNATWPEDVHRVMGGQAADLLLTDPPYNVAYTGKTKQALRIQNDQMGAEAFRRFLRDAFAAASAAMKPGAVFYIWHADSEGYNFRGACEDVSWKVRQCLIWKKQTLVMGRQDYHWMHEPCLYGWKEGAGHFWASDRKQTTVLEFDRPTRSTEHPTMKPVALFEYQMLNNTRGGELVLDTFGGSGTTMIAAEKFGRAARLLELDPCYADVIVQRWQEFTGKAATLEGDGRTFAQLASARAEAMHETHRTEAAGA